MNKLGIRILIQVTVLNALLALNNLLLAVTSLNSKFFRPPLPLRDGPTHSILPGQESNLWTGFYFRKADNLHKFIEKGVQLGGTLEKYLENTCSVYLGARATIPVKAIRFIEYARTGDSVLDLKKIKSTGVGDLYIELYGKYGISPACWTAFAWGLTLPTGKKKFYSKKACQECLGNNGHYELRVRNIFESEVKRWLLLKTDISYNWVFKRSEKMPPPFASLNISYILSGPPLSIARAWNYLLARCDVTIISCNNIPGINIGYELYSKNRERIYSKDSLAFDFSGEKRPIDVSLLRCNSESRAHRIRLELFLPDRFYGLFAGYMRTIAGFNTPCDSDIYLGFSLDY